MTEMLEGQVWRENAHPTHRVVVIQTKDGVGVAPFGQRTPVMVVDPERFQRHHTLIEDENGDKPKAEPAPIDFKIGDVVRLRSGGPSLTVVRSFTEEGGLKLRVVWHLADGKMELETLPAALVVASEPMQNYVTTEDILKNLP